MQCSKCGQEVPADAIYCPHCTGERKTSNREVIWGGIRGGLIGIFLGMLPGLWLLYEFGAVRGVKGIAVAVPLATFTTGFIIGLVKAKREWK